GSKKLDQFLIDFCRLRQYRLDFIEDLSIQLEKPLIQQILLSCGMRNFSNKRSDGFSLQARSTLDRLQRRRVYSKGNSLAFSDSTHALRFLCRPFQGRRTKVTVRINIVNTDLSYSVTARNAISARKALVFGSRRTRVVRCCRLTNAAPVKAGDAS